MFTLSTHVERILISFQAARVGQGSADDDDDDDDDDEGGDGGKEDAACPTINGLDVLDI